MNNNTNGFGISGGSAANSIGQGEEVNFDFTPLSVAAVSSLIFQKTGSGANSGAGSFGLYLDGVFSETISWTAGAANSKVLHSFAVAPAVSMIAFKDVSGAFRIAELSVQVPEPSVLALFGLGLLGLGISRRRKLS